MAWDEAQHKYGQRQHTWCGPASSNSLQSSLKPQQTRHPASAQPAHAVAISIFTVGGKGEVWTRRGFLARKTTLQYLSNATVL
jgi:hypothetical protein